MPVYNNAAFLHKAIESILKQTSIDFELIIINDGSTDDSEYIIKTFTDSRITYLYQENQGYPIAINNGLQQAKGDYIARMDGDDISCPNRLEQQVAFLNQHPEVIIVGTIVNYITPQGKLLHRHPITTTGWVEESWETIYQGKRLFADPTVVFRFETAKKVGLYRTYQRNGQDVDLWLRMLEQGGRAISLKQPLYYWRLHKNSISKSTHAAATNKIPRILAQERQITGSDRIMRGDSIDGLITEDILKKSYFWYFTNLWLDAYRCWEAKDHQSAIGYILTAIYIGRLNAVNRANLLYLLLRPFRKFLARKRA